MSMESEALADIMGAGLHEAEIGHALDELAGKVCEQVKDLAPKFGDLPAHRNNPAEKWNPTGEDSYRDSIEVDDLHGSLDTRRVISRDPKAIWIEIGTAHMPEYAPFTKAAAMFGSTTGPSFSVNGRDSMADEGVHHAHEHLRGEVEKLAKLGATGAAAHHLAAQRTAVAQARIARSAAFKAARPRRGRGR
jgi:hypothetical protein